MSFGPEEKGRTVFVGNIPYDVTKEEVEDILKIGGKIQEFNLILNRETGATKGYGFCKYADKNMADSAIRNLNGKDLRGRRLKIAPSDHSSGPNPGGGSGGGGPASGGGSSSSAQFLTVDQAINQLSPAEMYDVMSQMKSFVDQDRETARSLLLEQPQLAYALLQIQVKLGMLQTPLPDEMHSGRPGFTGRQPPSRGGGHNPPSLIPGISEEDMDELMKLSYEELMQLPDPKQRQQLMDLKRQADAMAGASRHVMR